jgi:hypothetical protein
VNLWQFRDGGHGVVRRSRGQRRYRGQRLRRYRRSAGGLASQLRGAPGGSSVGHFRGNRGQRRRIS